MRFFVTREHCHVIQNTAIHALFRNKGALFRNMRALPRHSLLRKTGRKTQKVLAYGKKGEMNIKKEGNRRKWTKTA
jgi:hypothetical protein